MTVHLQPPVQSAPGMASMTIVVLGRSARPNAAVIASVDGLSGVRRFQKVTYRTRPQGDIVTAAHADAGGQNIDVAGCRSNVSKAIPT